MGPKNSLLVRYEQGFAHVEATDERGGQTSIARFARREGFLTLPNVNSLDAVDTITAAWFTVYGWLDESTILAIEPATGDEPYIAFEKGDTVPVNGDDLRVISTVVETDINGHPIYNLEVNTAQQIRAINLERQLAQVAAGTLDGRTLAATPVARANTSQVQRPAQTFEQIWTWPTGAELGDGPEYRFTRPARLNRISAMAPAVGAGTSEWIMWLDGTEIPSIPDGPGGADVDATVRLTTLLDYHSVPIRADALNGSLIYPECITASDHAPVTIKLEGVWL